jgi:hypothetical protein
VNGRLLLLPFAITRADETSGCVGALTQDGTWIRPQPVSAHQVDGDGRTYQYGQWLDVCVRPSVHEDARPEDHDLDEDIRATGEFLSGDERLAILRTKSGPSVAAELEGQRSLGLIRVQARRLHLKPATGGKRFLRLEFADATSESFDWIVPEVALGKLAWPRVHGDTLDPGWADEVVSFWQGAETYLTIGLTKPNHRFPGRFRGCHPLVVGIHTEPDYLTAFEGDGAR